MSNKGKTKDFTINNTLIGHNQYKQIIQCFNTVNRAAYSIPPAQYIHYTSIQSFKAMFKPYAEERKNYILLFASNVQFLNDSSEFKTGYDLVSSEYDGLALKNGLTRELFLRDDAFTVSFCGEEDLLSQWKYYGKDSGVAIEFDFGDRVSCDFLWAMTKAAAEETAVEEKWEYDFGQSLKLLPSSVIYGKSRQKKAFQKIMSLIKDSGNGQYKDIIINSFIPYCKDVSFFEEKESRLLFYPINEDGALFSIKTPIKYRSTTDKLIPQFECRLAYHGQDNLENKPPIPIKNIMIGPGYNQTIVFNGVIDMLERGTDTGCSMGHISDEMISELKNSTSHRVKYDDILSGKKSIAINDLCVVTKNKKTRLDGEGGSVNDTMEYVTYKTRVGITVQMSATPFRA